MGVFVNRVLRKTWAMREEVRGGLRRWNNEELYGLC
jgi:hypothetical protein